MIATRILSTRRNKNSLFSFKMRKRQEKYAGSSQQAAVSRQLAAGSSQQAAVSRQQSAGSSQQAAGSRQQAEGSRQHPQQHPQQHPHPVSCKHHILISSS
jgi:hypothetical protein